MTPTIQSEVQILSEGFELLKDDLQKLLCVLLDYDTADELINFIDSYIEDNAIDSNGAADFYQHVRSEISNGVRNAYAAAYFEEKWGDKLTKKTLLWLSQEAIEMEKNRVPLFEAANILLNELRGRAKHPLVRSDDIGRKHLIGVISRSYNRKLQNMPVIVAVEFNNENNGNYNDLLDAVEEYIKLVSRSNDEE